MDIIKQDLVQRFTKQNLVVYPVLRGYQRLCNILYNKAQVLVLPLRSENFPVQVKIPMNLVAADNLHRQTLNYILNEKFKKKMFYPSVYNNIQEITIHITNYRIKNVKI